jgi:hypothetical protein
VSVDAERMDYRMIGQVTGLPGIFLLFCLMAACGGVPLQPNAPRDLDLSGSWRLIAGASGTPPSAQALRARGGMIAFVTDDFPVLRAEELLIEQNPGSMGIYFDGRNYRDVSWGTRRRGLWEVDAGWHDGSLIILSKARDASARETLTLSPDGQRLRVDIEVKSGRETVAVNRVFGRVPDDD